MNKTNNIVINNKLGYTKDCLSCLNSRDRYNGYIEFKQEFEKKRYLNNKELNEQELFLIFMRNTEKEIQETENINTLSFLNEYFISIKNKLGLSKTREHVHDKESFKLKNKESDYDNNEKKLINYLSNINRINRRKAIYKEKQNNKVFNKLNVFLKIEYVVIAITIIILIYYLQKSNTIFLIVTMILIIIEIIILYFLQSFVDEFLNILNKYNIFTNNTIFFNTNSYIDYIDSNRE